MERDPANKPIRVVLFGGGPTLERGVQEFILRLDAHPEIAFLRGFCQSKGQDQRTIIRDLWRRRRLLAGPLFVAGLWDQARRFFPHPGAEIQFQKDFSRVLSQISFVPDIHAATVLEQVKALKPELGLVYGSPILKPSLFEIPTFGTIGIHHGKVPSYRGKKTTFWAIYNGEDTAGVTIQKISRGLDTGDVIKQGEVKIGKRSLARVWDEVEKMGIELYISAILEIKTGAARPEPQTGTKGNLYYDPKLRDMLIFWARYLRKLIRPLP